jgi:hypothetical protein
MAAMKPDRPELLGSTKLAWGNKNGVTKTGCLSTIGENLGKLFSGIVLAGFVVKG